MPETSVHERTGGNTLFYTLSMARVHVDQGNLERAAEIYRYLAAREPEREDLKTELAGLEKRLSASAPDRLAALFGEWFELAHVCNRLRRLRRLGRDAGAGMRAAGRGE